MPATLRPVGKLATDSDAEAQHPDWALDRTVGEIGGSGDGNQPEKTAATSTTTTPASSDIDDECRADRGDQNSGGGVIAAWNHAYYIARNAVTARALATPNSSVVPADQLQGFIDSVPVGTNYCMRAKALSEDVYLVDLSELRPEGAERITQTVTTKKVDGKWFVDVFN